MKTPNTPDQVTRDNRKSWPKFILVMLLCMSGGAVLGYGSAWLVGSYSFDTLADAAGRAAGACAPFAVLAAVPFLLAALACCRRARALFAAWDGEDEELPARADARLDWALVWLTTAQLLALLLFAVSVSMMPLGYAGPGAILASAAELLAVLFAVITLQGRVVDLTRRFNPEKQGSVYDFKFRKKWLASCDEAERQRIGQAGFTGFMACNSSCLITAVVLMVLNALLPIGPLPSIAVMIPWIAGQAAYLAECVRAKKGPGRS